MTDTPAETLVTILNASVTEILDRIPRMGRVMVSASADSVTHELIAPVDQVLHHEQGSTTFQRASKDVSQVMSGAVHRVVVDRSSVMRDKHYPRLSFEAADGRPLFAVVGFEGLEPFDAALEGIVEARAAKAEAPAAPVAEAPALPDPRRIADALTLAATSDADFTVGYETKGGLLQFWTGKIAELKPAMGFINIIQPAFHLHVKDGAIGWWQPLPLKVSAEDMGRPPSGRMRLAAFRPDGAMTALTLYGPADLFEPALFEPALA
jgi:hypothetical protein